MNILTSSLFIGVILYSNSLPTFGLEEEKGGLVTDGKKVHWQDKKSSDCKSGHCRKALESENGTDFSEMMKQKDKSCLGHDLRTEWYKAEWFAFDLLEKIFTDKSKHEEGKNSSDWEEVKSHPVLQKMLGRKLLKITIISALTNESLHDRFLDIIRKKRQLKLENAAYFLKNLEKAFHILFPYMTQHSIIETNCNMQKWKLFKYFENRKVLILLHKLISTDFVDNMSAKNVSDSGINYPKYRFNQSIDFELFRNASQFDSPWSSDISKKYADSLQTLLSNDTEFEKRYNIKDHQQTNQTLFGKILYSLLQIASNNSLSEDLFGFNKTNLPLFTLEDVHLSFYCKNASWLKDLKSSNFTGNDNVTLEDSDSNFAMKKVEELLKIGINLRKLQNANNLNDSDLFLDGADNMHAYLKNQKNRLFNMSFGFMPFQKQNNTFDSGSNFVSGQSRLLTGKKNEAITEYNITEKRMISDSYDILSSFNISRPNGRLNMTCNIWIRMMMEGIGDIEKMHRMPIFANFLLDEIEEILISNWNGANDNLFVKPDFTPSFSHGMSNKNNLSANSAFGQARAHSAKDTFPVKNPNSSFSINSTIFNYVDSKKNGSSLHVVSSSHKQSYAQTQNVSAEDDFFTRYEKHALSDPIAFLGFVDDIEAESLSSIIFDVVNNFFNFETLTQKLKFKNSESLIETLQEKAETILKSNMFRMLARRIKDVAQESTISSAYKFPMHSDAVMTPLQKPFSTFGGHESKDFPLSSNNDLTDSFSTKNSKPVEPLSPESMSWNSHLRSERVNQTKPPLPEDGGGDLPPLTEMESLNSNTPEGKEPVSPSSISTNESSKPLKMISDENNEPVSPSRSESPKPLKPISGENSEPVSPSSSESPKPLKPISGENSEPVSLSSSESPKPLQPIRGESIEPISPNSNESPIPLKPISDENIEPVSPSSNESLKPLKPISDENIELVSPSSNESLIPLKAISDENIEPVSPSSNESLKPLKPISGESIEPVSPNSNESPKPLKPISGESIEPLSPSSSESPIPLKPISGESIEPVSPSSSDFPKPLKPISGESIEPVSPSSNESPKPLQPISGENIEPVSPSSSEFPMPLKPISGESIEPVSPSSNESLKPLQPISGESIEPVSPSSSDFPKPLKPISGESIEPVSPSSSDFPKPLKPISGESIEPVSPSSNESLKPLKPISGESIEPVSPNSNESPKPLKPISGESIEPLSPSSSESPIPLKPISGESIEPVSPSSSDFPKPLKPISGESIEPVSPSSNESPKPLQPISGENIEPVSPSSSEFPMPLKPISGESIEPVSPSSNESLKPLKPISGENIEPISPSTNETLKPLKPISGESIELVSPSSSASPIPLKPISDESIEPVSPSSSQSPIPLKPISGESIELVSPSSSDFPKPLKPISDETIEPVSPSSSESPKPLQPSSGENSVPVSPSNGFKWLHRPFTDEPGKPISISNDTSHHVSSSNDSLNKQNFAETRDKIALTNLSSQVFRNPMNENHTEDDRILYGQNGISEGGSRFFDDDVTSRFINRSFAVNLIIEKFSPMIAQNMKHTCNSTDFQNFTTLWKEASRRIKSCMPPRHFNTSHNPLIKPNNETAKQHNEKDIIVVSKYQVKMDTEDEGLKVSELSPQITTTVIVSGLPSDKLGHFQYKERILDEKDDDDVTEDSGKTKQTNRLSQPSLVEDSLVDKKTSTGNKPNVEGNGNELKDKETDDDSDDGDKAYADDEEKEYEDGFEVEKEQEVYPIKSNCNQGMWKCVTIGTLLEPNSVIRFVRNSLSDSIVGATKIILTSTSTERQFSVWVFLLPPTVDEESGFDEQGPKYIQNNATIHLLDGNPVKIDLEKVEEKLRNHLEGYENLKELQIYSNQTQDFFTKLKVTNENIDYLLENKLLKHFVVVYQGHGKNNRIKNSNKITLKNMEEILLQSKSKNFSETYTFLAKYQYQRNWTRFHIKIDPLIEVQPGFESKDVSFPSFPYKFPSNYEGTIVGELAQKISFAVLPEDQLGIAIQKVGKMEFGAWQYKCNNGDWRNLYVVEGKILFLHPNCRIMFKPSSQDQFWSAYEARFYTGIHLRLWNALKLSETNHDLTLFGTMAQYTNYGFVLIDYCGNNQNCVDIFTEIPGLLGHKLVTVIVERLGCNGIKSSWPGIQLDGCGVCGGRNLCFDCNGDRDGGAKVDKCGVCSGGRTNVKPNAKLDCGNTCDNQNFLDDCGFCESRIRPLKLHLKDCAGTCHGKARLNECNVCVKPNQTEPIVVKDACGVCGGDNSTCTGCDGIVNSGFIEDDCGSCLNPSNSSFNKGCSGNVTDLAVLKSFYYLSTQLNEVAIILTGKFSNFATARCLLEGIAQRDLAEPATELDRIQLDVVDIISKTKQTAATKDYEKELKTLHPKTQIIVLVIKVSFLMKSQDQLFLTVVPSCVLESPARENYVAQFDTAIVFQRAGYPRIDQIQPAYVPTGLGNVKATFTGKGFLKYVSYQCLLFNFPANATEGRSHLQQDLFRISKASYINRTEITCDLPVSSLSGEVDIYLVTEKEYQMLEPFKLFSNLRNRGVKFYFREPAPKVTHTSLTKTLNYVIIKFDKPIQRHKQLACSDIFDKRSLELLGKHAFCKNVEFDQIVIKPSSDSSLLHDSATGFQWQTRMKRDTAPEPLGTLRLLAGAIKGESNTGSFKNFPDTTIEIHYPTNLVPPKAYVEGQKSVSHCDELILHFFADSSVGQWPILLEWQVIPDIGDLQIFSVASSTPVGKMIMTFEKSWKNVTYSLRVTNAIGMTSERATHTVLIDSKPRVVKMFLAGQKQRKILSKQPLVLKAVTKILLANCDGNVDSSNALNSSITYVWTVSPMPDFAFTSPTKSKLRISSEKLTAKVTYNFTVIALYSGTEGKKSISSDSAIVFVQSSPLVARIQRSYSDGVVNMSSNLILNGLKSYDPDQHPAPLQYTWSCETMAGESCVLKDPAEDGTNNVVRADEVFSKQDDPAIINIPAKLFTPNQKYNFTLRVAKGNRSSAVSKLVKIKMLSGVFPRIQFVSNFDRSKRIDEIIRIKAVVFLNEGGFFSGKLAWASVSSTLYNEVPNLAIASRTSIVSNITIKGKRRLPVNLVLKPNILRPGLPYSITLQVKSSENDSLVISSANISFVTSSKPTGGMLQVYPINGSAMSTDFTVRTTGWAGPITTLTDEDDVSQDKYVYRFGYYRTVNGKQRVTTLMTYSEQFQVSNLKLPPGEGEDYNLTLVVFVKNPEDTTRGFSAKATTTVSVHPLMSKDVIDEAFDNVNNLAKEAIITGDPNQGAAILVALDDAASETGSDGHKQIIRDLADDFVQSIEDFQPATETEAVETLQSANSVISRVKISDQSVDAASQLPETILKTIYVDETTTDLSRKKRDIEPEDYNAAPELSVDMAADILTTYDAIFESADPASSVLIGSRERFQRTATVITNLLCQSIAFDEPPIDVVTSSSKLTVAKYSKISENTMIGDRNHQIYFSLDVSQTYDDWACLPTQQCSGACLSVGMFEENVVTWFQTDAEEKRLSDIILVSIHNPETGRKSVDMIPPTNAESVTIDFAEVGEKNYSTSYECRRWSDFAWMPSGCKVTKTQISTEANGKVGITCGCSIAHGYFAVFATNMDDDAEEVDTTTVTVTTQVSQKCAYPLEEAKLCSSLCIPDCENHEDTQETCKNTSCDEASYCVCPFGQVFNEKKKCVDQKECSAGLLLDLPRTWMGIMIGSVSVGVLALVIIAIVFVYKAMKKNNQDKVKLFKGFVESYPVAMPTAPSGDQPPHYDPPPGYFEPPGTASTSAGEEDYAKQKRK